MGYAVPYVYVRPHTAGDHTQTFRKHKGLYASPVAPVSLLPKLSRVPSCIAFGATSTQAHWISDITPVNPSECLPRL